MAPDEASGGAGAVPSRLDPESQQWAIQRRIDDVFAKLGEKFGDLTGRVEVRLHPDTTFEQIGGLREAKSIVRSLGTALTDPELYRKWGITPPKGVLLFGPPGTGKSLLARALATETGAVFYHLKLMNLTSKFGPTTGELLPQILTVAREQGKGVIFLDDANALSLGWWPRSARSSTGSRTSRGSSWWARRAGRTPSTPRSSPPAVWIAWWK